MAVSYWGQGSRTVARKGLYQARVWRVTYAVTDGISDPGTRTPVTANPGVSPPYRVEAGTVGIAGCALAGNVHDSAGTIYENEFSAAHFLGTTSQQAINDVLPRIFEALFAMADAKPPPGLYGFPPPG